MSRLRSLLFGLFCLGLLLSLLLPLLEHLVLLFLEGLDLLQVLLTLKTCFRQFLK